MFRTITPSIRLISVFDTSAWTMKLSGNIHRENLEKTLDIYECITPQARQEREDLLSKSDMAGRYTANNQVWAHRPLSDALIKYAAQDVCHLFVLREKILAQATGPLNLSTDQRQAITAER